MRIFYGMSTPLHTVGRRRSHNRKAAASETLRLRAYTRIEREIDRRKRLGPFTSIDLGKLLGDGARSQALDDMAQIRYYQAEEDLTAIRCKRTTIGMERLLLIAEVLNLDIDTLFAPIEHAPRKPAEESTQVAA